MPAGPWSGPAYDDGGYSGGSTNRPNLQQLLDDVRYRKVDVIVVYLVRDLRARNVCTKVRIFDTGKTRGGIPFGRGALSHLLRNRFCQVQG